MRTSVRTMFAGFTGWARMAQTSNESLRVTDTAITVVATLLVAVGWAMFR